tara:strand:- start:171 stop:335 length:165 start_codon:yes stop_codon:yes gene_type:complete
MHLIESSSLRTIIIVPVPARFHATLREDFCRQQPQKIFPLDGLQSYADACEGFS